MPINRKKLDMLISEETKKITAKAENYSQKIENLIKELLNQEEEDLSPRQAKDHAKVEIQKIADTFPKPEPSTN